MLLSAVAYLFALFTLHIVDRLRFFSLGMCMCMCMVGGEGGVSECVSANVNVSVDI